MTERPDRETLEAKWQANEGRVLAGAAVFKTAVREEAKQMARFRVPLPSVPFPLPSPLLVTSPLL
jgi:hypothetical protein